MIHSTLCIDRAVAHMGSPDAYRYRGTDPTHRENVGLRKAMQLQVPMVYFHGVTRGRYLAVWPVFIVGDNPGALTFTIAADDAAMAEPALLRAGTGTFSAHELDPRRAYITASIKVRVHQRSFRERVLDAYRDRCSVCRLGHRDLLDAAHIIADREPTGVPVVANGLALCKLHHAAYDRDLLGIRPDYVVEVHRRVLDERDGPMLRHGLQGVHHSRLILPAARASRPDPGRLAERYDRFCSVA